jgi:ribosomal protein S18 acetylase RimI-like enzyme
MHVRALAPGDRTAVRSLALVNRMFAPEEMGGFDEMLSGHLDGSTPDHHWVVAETAGAVTGAGYYAPEPFADRVWNLRFLAVHPDAHGRGVGTAVVGYLVDHLVVMGEDTARVLVVETSGTEAYARARAFYLARGFDEEARIREYYGPGDDKVVFWRRVPG